jgi:hypothetical protein
MAQSWAAAVWIKNKRENSQLQDLTVMAHPGPIEFTLALGAIFTISFLSDSVRPYIRPGMKIPRFQ